MKSALFWGIALSYVFFSLLGDYPLAFLHKAIPALMLAAWILSQNFNGKVLVVAAFTFCALGDMLLALPFEQSFLTGLSAFLVGHLLFTCFFVKWCYWTPNKSIWLAILGGSVIAAASLILPAAGDILLPVAAYILVITAMSASAILAAKNHRILIFGAIVFMVSDLLIGINKFVVPIPFEHLAIMLSYYLALYCLAIGIVKRTSVK